jgi:beta-glucosidase
MVASVVRPVKELKGFRKIFLKKGETKEVKFIITDEMLRFYNNDLKFVSEPGKFQLFIGTDSKDVVMAEFELL